MRIIVDGDADFKGTADSTNVGAALTQVTNYLHGKRRAILAVIINGQNVSPDDIPTIFENVPTEEIQTVEVQSESIVALARESLDEIQEVLPELPVACHSLAEVLKDDATNETKEHFRQLLEIWNTIKQREQLILDSLEISEHELALKERTLSEWKGELEQYMVEARHAFEEGDFATLSDLLEYELAPRAEFETEIVEFLLAQMEEL